MIKKFESFNKDIDPYDEDDWDEPDIAAEGIEMLIGKTLTSIIVSRNKNMIKFITNKGKEYLMYHEQNCCESVVIEDIVGDLEDLKGTPILRATEDTNRDDPPESYDYSFTWTFYNISTIKGHVTLRWLGTSNGYYSESVNFEEIN